MEVVYKELALLMKIRFKPFIERRIEEYQAYFRKGRTTTNLFFFTTKDLTSYECKIIGVALFVEFRRAYDSIKRTSLINIIKEFDILSKLMKYLKMIQR